MKKRRKKRQFHKVLLAIVVVAAAFFVYTGRTTLPQTMQSKVNETLGDIVAGEIVEVASVSSNRYAYEQLTSEEQTLYDEIYDCILSHESRMRVSASDADVLEHVYNCVIADYGELFWVSGFSYRTYSNWGETYAMEFMPKYTYTLAEREEFQAQVDAVIEEWLSGIDLDASDYEKSKYVYELLVNNVVYDENSANNQNILSVFLGGASVCQGYADAAQVLLYKLGVPAVTVTGTAAGEPHAWNLVLLDGDYYYMDATWGDSHYLSEEDGSNRIDYAYLNITSTDLAAADHAANGTIPLPTCDATADNYYVEEGCFFSSADYDAIGVFLRSAVSSGAMDTTIRLASSEDYARVMEYFFEDGHAFDYVTDIQRLRYFTDESLCVLTFEFIAVGD